MNNSSTVKVYAPNYASDTCRWPTPPTITNSSIFWDKAVNAVTLCARSDLPFWDMCHDQCFSGSRFMYHIEERWPIQYAYPIYGMAFPFFFVLLIISNAFVVLVLSRRHMVTPTNTVLKYMAVADLFVGLVSY